MKILIAWYPSILSMEILEQQLIEDVLQARTEMPEKLRGKSDPTWCELILEAPSVQMAVFYRNHVRDLLLRATKGNDTVFPAEISWFVSDDEDQPSLENLNAMLRIYDDLQVQIGMVARDLKATRNNHPIKEIGDIRRRLENLIKY